MNINDGIDSKKRHTLKLLAGGAASSLLIGLPAFAGEPSAATSPGRGGNVIDCQLILRAGGSHAHLLMNNQTQSEIAVARFVTQFIQFKDNTMNMADAYVNPVIIPSNDRVMVRLNVEAGLQKLPVNGDVVDMNASTRYLQQGTGVVSLRVRMIDGVGTIENTPVLV